MRHFAIALMAFAAAASISNRLSGQDFKPDWQSLAAHDEAPEWFKDSKLGIYFHWGVYAVPAYGSEWYPRNMFLKGHQVNKHHVDVYGDPGKYGYHRFVDQWQTPEFDATEWAKLFKATGARFAGPVAEHHDGFSLWDSQATPWNSVDKGPKRDLLGELTEAIRAEGMKTIATFHHARNFYGHFEGMVKDYPSANENEETAILYAQMPAEQFHQMWLDKLAEVIDQYQPDIIWFDSWLDRIPESYRQEFAAYYLNAAKKWDRDVVIVRKQEDLPLDMSVLDHEKSREPRAAEKVWMTDDTISTGSWCYTDSLKIKPTHKVVHALVDTVAKNGIVLLNISPMANGRIPDDQRQVLAELGEWMNVNGEAIYATRPWKAYGEGPTVEPEGGFKKHGEFLKLEYSAADVRYTQSKDGTTVYAITLGWPKSAIQLQSVRVQSADDQATVQLLGHDGTLAYEVDDQGQLTIQMPAIAADDLPCDCAYSFKLTGFELDAAK
ncbi:alpha-L-fucosidase [Crateriforma conspicua]|uniref:alpha-L-fucosidase n=1 Tax=Crateriforma conspicua TaxID=2527996 RepID=UPI00118AE514|nr:alpha-L-fucosidase [Crateriforma conspicua]QDV61902.1 Alpha-L-fucosidase [Crateriforma conspicua]